MTQLEMNTLGSLLVERAGLDEEKTVGDIAYFKRTLLNLEYSRCEEAVRHIILQDTVKGKEPSKWIGAIARFCGAGQTQSQEKAALPGCPLCNYSGTIEVPVYLNNCKDNGTEWNGMYTMMVACNECQAGNSRAGHIINLRQYESKYPYWRNDYPRCRLEMQLLRASYQAVPRDDKEAEKHHGRIARIRRELDSL